MIIGEELASFPGPRWVEPGNEASEEFVSCSFPYPIQQSCLYS